MKHTLLVTLILVSLHAGCKDVKTEKALADAKEELSEKEDDLEASQKKLKAAQSAQAAADERANLAEAKLKEAEAKLKTQRAGDVSSPSTPSGANCDKYWTKLRACNDAAVKSAPPSVREQVQKSMDDAEKQTKEAWKNMDPATMERACKTMIDALDSNPNCPKQ
jgi:hypothetical protein